MIEVQMKVTDLRITALRSLENYSTAPILQFCDVLYDGW